MARPWEVFAQGKGPPSATNPKWGALQELTHGTHLNAASRIAEDGKITGALIYDGKLKATRTEVIYFSPNTWSDGSRYGAFEFAVHWDTLLRGRTLYWVEAIRSYKIPIYRFLLSSRDVSALGVTPYDPDTDAGPIRRVGADWFWAQGFVAEIVIDETLPLSNVFQMNFVRHHEHYCSLKRSSCPEAGYSKSWRNHAAFMAFLLGTGLMTLEDQLKDTRGMPSFAAESALTHLYLPLVREPSFGKGQVSDDKTARLVLRAAALLLHSSTRGRAKKLAALIDTQDRAERAFLEIIKKHFSAPNFEFS
ncbi:MAG TPA: hypothetical protein VF655_04000 [Allosphingosinicella sp.]|jgi:hypothetical protein